MKRLIIGLLTVVLLAGLVLSTGCTKPVVEEEKLPVVEEEKLLIVTLWQVGTVDFCVPVRIGAEDAAEKYGVDSEWLFPSNFDILEQIGMVESLISKGEVDGLVLQSNDPATLIPVVKRAVKAGIPVVLSNELNEREGFDSFCGADGIEIGKLMGKELASNLLGEGVWAKAVGYEGTGEVEGKIAFMTDGPGYLSLEMRLKGARDYLSQFPGIEDLGTYDSTLDQVKAQEAAVNILTANPDLAGFVSVGAMPTVAIGMAVQEMGLTGKVIISGMDLLPQELELVKSHVVASLVGQDQYGQGYIPVQYLSEYLLNNKPLPRFLPTNLEVVNLENIDSIIEREEAYMKKK